jgi:translation initiation factor 2B subunit (eIF-2B alpha/beta/delta family)
MARELASAGIRVELTTDSALTEFVVFASAVVVGADAVSERGIRNKVGTDALAHCALEHGVPVWVLADTSKLLPRALWGVRDGFARNDGSPQEVWPRHPAAIRVLNPYFAWTRFRSGIRVLTETGWTTPRVLRKLITRLDLPKSWPRGFD